MHSSGLSSPAATSSASSSTASLIFNNVFFLRYVEVESELRRGLNVLKMRQSEHLKGLLEFTIDANGLTFGERIEGLSGMLGWSALRGSDEP